jgi:hypothetical protein
MAGAVDQPAHLAGRPELEVASGAAVRVQRSVRFHRAPASARRAWARFVAEAGPSFQASWDASTRVPTRIWGGGMPAAGTVASLQAAEAFARAFLSRHLELLAPGASMGDFVLASNDLDQGMRTLGFVQQHQGMPVLGGQLSFRFKADRLFVIGSEALPGVHVAPPASVISMAAARAAAQGWVGSGGAIAVAGAVDGPFVLPLVGDAGVLGYPAVLRVMVEAEQPLGRWAVYVDAQTGAPIAKKQTLLFANGTVQYNAPVRWPGSERNDFPAVYAEHSIDGGSATGDGSGLVSWLGDAPASIIARPYGPRVSVSNAAGADATQTLTLQPGGNVVWNQASDELVDAQLNAFIHGHKAKDYARIIAPALPFLNQQLDATVNISDVCNAFSDGTTINFYQSGSGCENTGRLPDVVYHEFGHSLHAHAVIQGVGEFESALSEGISDYFSSTITGDPAMGRGFFFSASPLRHIDPDNVEKRWPDDIDPDPHQTGLIIGGALWDLRKALVEKLGPVAGVAHTDQLFYQGIRRAVDVPSMYPEVLAADDDDGDLSNGTPNACEIAQTFGVHGLRKVTGEISDLSTMPPNVDGFQVSLELVGLFVGCQSDDVTAATLRWHLRDEPEVSGAVEMSQSANLLEGKIPSQADGQVVNYQVEVSFAAGGTTTYPENAADPFYEFFVGQVEPLYCTDFETDPEADGWTHGLTSGETGEGADDWQWSSPKAPPASGDPTDAFSGDKVFGNDLGGGEYNGSYQPDKVNFALSPVVDTSGYETVRLQYRRWLNVEDAHFDKASIYANDQLAWQNHDSQQGDESSIHHRDREWRFHDVDLTPHIVDGGVQIKYEIASDQGLELGGWTLDDFCVVAYLKSAPNPCFADPTLPECDGAGGGSSGAGVGGGDGVPTPADGSGPDGDSGCGCRLPGGNAAGAGAGAAAIALALAFARRRRRRSGLG